MFYLQLMVIEDRFVSATTSNVLQRIKPKDLYTYMNIEPKICCM